MGQDVAELGLVVDSSQILRATGRLKRMEVQGARNESSAKKLTRTFGLMKPIVAGLFAAFAVKKVLETAAAFESMKVSLETVTGSAERAQMAFDGILEFATNTPFQVSELTDAFIKLKALGLEPSEESLTSFGNTASAMGKSLNQMIEAVADAATGEFERLKEFGIKAKSEGDNVTFTFQGVATIVKKNATDIEGYLRSIGQVQFAGAMEKQMDTVNGAFSNAADAVDQLIVALGESGLNRAIAAVTNSFTFMVRAIKEFVDPSIKTQMVDIKEEMISIGEEIQKRVERRVNFGDLQQELDVLSKEYAALESKLKTGGIAEAGVGGENAAQAAADAERRRWDEINRVSVEQQELHKALAINAQLTENEEVAELQRIANEQVVVEQARMQAASMAAQMDYQQKRAEAVGQTFANLAVLTASTSKKMFKIGKAASIASALINTYQAVTKTMAATPYPWNIPLAIAQGAAGLVQVQQIKAQQFSGQAHSGMDRVPREGSYNLQRGEMVLDPGTSEQVRNNVLGGASVNVTVYANDAESFEEQQKRSADNIWNIIMDRMNEEGLSLA